MGKVCNVAAPVTSVNGITINRSKKCHTSNYTNVTERTIEYIVFHYTGNSKDTAANNANYFMGANRGASAHYFVDDTSIWQSIDVNDRAWHCGTDGTYYHNYCRNTNSIGIEMCCTAGNYKISNKTKENAAQLGAALCKYFGITDIDKYVLRHYDVTHKSCPAQMAGSNNAEWKAFKTRIKEILGMSANATVNNIYRVRKSWEDSNSQIGAYSNLNNAKKACDDAGSGYYIFDGFGKVVYPDAIDILVKNNIIASPDYWEDAQYDLNYLDVLLENIAKEVGPNVVEDIDTAREAIEHLVECKVINTPDYWLSNYSKLKYLDKLLISAASHIPSKFKPYMVKVTADVLNIRQGPGTGHSVVGRIKDDGKCAYTIIDEKNGFGLLKSYSKKRDGWISLAYTKKV